MLVSSPISTIASINKEKRKLFAENNVVTFSQKDKIKQQKSEWSGKFHII